MTKHGTPMPPSIKTPALVLYELPSTIRFICKQEDITLEQFGQAMHVSRDEVQHWLKRRRFPNQLRLLHIIAWHMEVLERCENARSKATSPQPQPVPQV